MDKSAPSFIEMAHANIDGSHTKGPVKAFFWLTLEAIRQLTRIADSNEKIAKRLEDWSCQDQLSVLSNTG